ncbi:hypothetical protein DPMN_040732 [Dreissena polymorpha]|uniref:Secreted protein n=1 Tax=Dreissena polymorpha TaxID=45954 RepID=A0A9D4CVL1_DREPO|nr:hypothetical protein DPMN_040732 [Dreissena polymorpha]
MKTLILSFLCSPAQWLAVELELELHLCLDLSSSSGPGLSPGYSSAPVSSFLHATSGSSEWTVRRR